MSNKLKTLGTGILSFFLTLLIVSVTRYHLTFKELCQMNEGVPQGPSALNIMSCPSISDVVLITFASPLFFLISLIIGIIASYGYFKWNVKE